MRMQGRPLLEINEQLQVLNILTVALTTSGAGDILVVETAIIML